MSAGFVELTVGGVERASACGSARPQRYTEAMASEGRSLFLTINYSQQITPLLTLHIVWEAV